MAYKHNKDGFCEKKGWINIYKTRKGEPYTHDAIFYNERLAKDFGKIDKDYVTTIEIEWEEEG